MKDYNGTRDILDPNEWAHVTAVMDSDFDVQFYVNGEFIETVAGSRPGRQSFDVTYLGSLDDELQFFLGEMRDVRVYDTELTPDRIVMLARV